MDLLSSRPFWPLRDGLPATFPPLARNESCDVAIMGGGIAGAVIARELTAAKFSVVVLDRVVAALEAREGPLPPLRLLQVKFLSPLRPGQAADVALDGGGGRWRFRVTTGDAVVASGELVAMPEGVP